MSKVNINLPGWHQTVDEPERKVFRSGDGYRLVLNVQGGTVDVSIEETAPYVPVRSGKNE